jgi:hypothetical protein
MASTKGRLKGAGWIVDAAIKTVLTAGGKINQLPLLALAFDEYRDAKGNELDAPGEQIWLQYEAPLVRLPKRVNVGDRLSVSGQSELVYALITPQSARQVRRQLQKSRQALAQELQVWLGRRQLTGARWRRDEAKVKGLAPAWLAAHLSLDQWQAQVRRLLTGYGAHTRHALVGLQHRQVQAWTQVLTELGVQPLTILVHLSDVRYRWLTKPLPGVIGRRAEAAKAQDPQYYRELVWEVMANRNQRQQLGVPLVDLDGMSTALRERYQAHFPQPLAFQGGIPDE